MIKFTYEVVHGPKTGKLYIEWEATWDGKLDDPEFLESFKHVGFHPFVRSIDYQEQAEWLRLCREQPDKYQDAEIPDDPDDIRVVGDTVAHNPVTLAICEMLAHKESIHNWSGNTDEYAYWCKMLGVLSDLWD